MLKPPSYYLIFVYRLTIGRDCRGIIAIIAFKISSKYEYVTFLLHILSGVILDSRAKLKTELFKHKVVDIISG